MKIHPSVKLEIELPPRINISDYAYVVSDSLFEVCKAAYRHDAIEFDVIEDSLGKSNYFYEQFL